MLRFYYYLAAAVVLAVSGGGFGTVGKASAAPFSCTYDDATDRYCETALNATLVDRIAFVGGADPAFGVQLPPTIPLVFDGTDAPPQLFDAHPGGILTGVQAFALFRTFGQRHTSFGTTGSLGLHNNGSVRMGYIFNGGAVSLDSLDVGAFFGFAVDRLTVEGWLNGVLVASQTLLFGGNDLSKGAYHNIIFGSSFDTIDQVLFTPFYNNTNNFGAFGIDNATFSTAPVPEPATLGLVALGLAGLGFAARRRKI